jgi:hypothetical protein
MSKRKQSRSAVSYARLKSERLLRSELRRSARVQAGNVEVVMWNSFHEPGIVPRQASNEYVRVRVTDDIVFGTALSVINELDIFGLNLPE